MPLTEQEQQAFQEMVRRLGDPEHRRARRRLVLAGAGLAGGLAVVVATFVASVVAAVAGYVLMVAACLLAARSVRVLAGPAWTGTGREAPVHQPRPG